MRIDRSGAVQVVAALLLAFVCQAPRAQAGNCFNPSSLEALETCAASLQADQFWYLARYGDIYFKGEAPATKPDKPRGIAFYTRAAEAGDVDAQLTLANALEKTGAPPDVWLKWVEKSALVGHDRALSWLQHVSGIGYERMENDRRLREQYLQTLTTVLEQGRLSDSWYWTLAGLMGGLHEGGHAGVPPNSQEAVRWYLRAADRGGIKSLWAALRIYKLGQGMPQDRKKAEQLLERFFREQSAFFEREQAVHLEWLYSAADLGFSSVARRLADIHLKGALGVKADVAAAQRWRAHAQKAKWVEEHGKPYPVVASKAKRDQMDVTCESDAGELVEKELRSKPSVITHTAHFNRTLGLCLASVTYAAKPAGYVGIQAQGAQSPARVVIDVRGRSELAVYVPGTPKSPPLSCRTQSLRLRASFEMQQQGCASLEEYEAFVEQFMRD